MQATLHQQAGAAQLDEPRVCPKRKSPHWNKPRKNKRKAV
jgi:hypothetical protein